MRRILITSFLVNLFAICAFAQTTEFTYQGTLKDGGNPANANYDFEFALYDAPSGGNLIGGTLMRNAVLVTNGVLAVKLDFGSVFPGANRYLEVRVKLTGQPNLTPLVPRQLVNSAPYSVKTLNADNATNAVNATTADGLSVACINCVTSSQIGSVNGSAVTGTIPVASVPAGSASYIQSNPASQQSSSNFNISGNGAVGGMFGIGQPFPTFPLSFASTLGDKISLWPNGAASYGFGIQSSLLQVHTDISAADIAFGYGSSGSFTENMRIKGNGTVGIGTSSPLGRLQVVTTNDTNPPNIPAWDSRHFVIGGTGNSGGLGMSYDQTNNVSYIESLKPNLAFGNLILQSGAGNVGIGTTSPASKLQVFGAGSVRVTADSDSNAGFGLSLNNQIKWSVATVSPGQFQIYNQVLNSNAVWIDPANNNVGIGVTNPGYLLDVGQRMRLRSGGNTSTSAGIWFNNNANSEAAFIGMEDDTHIGFFGNGGASWKFGMNTTNGALKVNGDEGQAGQVITSNGASAAQWKSPTNTLYQQTYMVADTGFVTPSTTPTLVPGLSQTVSVSGNAKIIVQFGVRATPGFCVGCGASSAQVEVWVDGARARRVFQDIANSTENFISGSTLLSVGSGSHTIEIRGESTGPLVNFGCGVSCGDRSSMIVQVIPE